MASAPDHDKFCHRRCLSFLRTVVSDNGDIVMSSYAAVVEEVFKLFKSFGEDQQEPLLLEILENVDLLKELSGEDFGPDYATAQNMLEYETRNNLVQPHTELPSGTHTMLRFHRISHYIQRCLERIMDESVPNEDITAELIKIYSETLGHFGLELMVASFMWAMPTFVMSRERLMEHVGFARDQSRFRVWLRQVTTHLKEMNDVVHALYEKHQLHDLPLN